jgi:hypothetical protein
MAKKKLSTEELIFHIDKYFYEINHEQIKCLKYTDIAEYLSKATGFAILEYDIRRNKEIASYVQGLKSQARKAIEKDTIVFVPLDVSKFINKNGNPNLLKRALLERDQYYKGICESACTTVGEGIRLNKKMTDLIAANKVLKTEGQKMTDDLATAQEEIKILKNQIKRMKDILRENVYPEIANELLREMGLLNGGEDIINSSSYRVISDTDSIIGFINKNKERYSDNNVIQRLFDKL